MYFLRSSLASTLALAYRDQGRTGTAAQVYAEARAISETGDNIMLALLAAYELGKLRVEQGQLRRAEQIYQASMTWLKKRFGAAVAALPLSGAAHVGLGRLLFEWNRLDDAREHLELGMARTQHQGGLGIDRDGLLALSLVYQLQNKSDQALETMAQAVAHARRSPRQDAQLRAQTYQVRLWLAQGNIHHMVTHFIWNTVPELVVPR